MRLQLRNIPNFLSLFRVIGILPLTVFSFYGLKNAFIILLVPMYLSDILDGYIARKFGVSSELGRKLDSLGDNLFFPGIPIWFYLLDIKNIEKAMTALLILIIYMILIQAISLFKFKKPESLHLWSLKLTYLPGVAIVFYTLLTGRLPLTIFYLFCFWIFLGFTEKLVILLFSKKNLDFEITSIFQLRRK